MGEGVGVREAKTGRASEGGCDERGQWKRDGRGFDARYGKFEARRREVARFRFAAWPLSDAVEGGVLVVIYLRKEPCHMSRA